MLYKRDIINTLFVASFPIYGIGAYISASKSPSLGYIVAVIPYVFITIFYLIDLLYKREFSVRANIWYILMLLFLLSTVASLFTALHKHLPDINRSLIMFRSVLLVMPFQAFVIVHLYNEEEKSRLVRLTLLSLSILLWLNLVGYYVFGFTNQLHSIEGRVNLPFLDGVYSGSCLLAVINLMLFYYWDAVKDNLPRLIGWMTYFVLNLLLLFLINSRLTIIVFIVVLLLLLFRVITRVNVIYWVSIFTIPILLNTGLLIYRILNLPVFVSLLKRVDLIDVTTFNGRAFLWQDALDWLWHDQRGLVFGNGYRGHYFLDITSNVAKLWNEQEPYHLHLHSTSLEILVSQGLVVLAIFLILFYKLYSYYSRAFEEKLQQGAFLGAVVFMLFIMQVDTFLYLESLGAVIFAWMLSYIAISSPQKEQMPSNNKET